MAIRWMCHSFRCCGTRRAANQHISTWRRALPTTRCHKAFQDAAMATRLLDDDARVIRDTLSYENASGLQP